VLGVVCGSESRVVAAAAAAAATTTTTTTILSAFYFPFRESLHFNATLRVTPLMRR
jgi:hypothetical protein